MEDNYGNIADLSNYINGHGRTIFHPIPLAVSGHHHSSFTQPHQNYSDMTHGQLVDRQETEKVPEFRPDSNNITCCGLYSNGGWEMEGAAGGLLGDGGNGRWPRQETLTLLEIRSRLHSKFKESIHKGPLWDEVSRIMSEEHGYQRTGKKCREKFDNLYKYYKKTKDGKSGRQDGKNYRFFRQLEALYGDSKSAAASFSGSPLAGTSHFPYGTVNAVVSNIQRSLQPSKLSAESISISKSSGFYSERSDPKTMLDDDSSEKGKNKKSKKKWKAKVMDFIDLEMRDLMEKQDDRLERMTRMIEEKEQERLVREEEWRKQEEARIEREERFWATQRCWIERRNSSMMETMRILTGKDLVIENDLPSRSTTNKDFNCVVPPFHVTRSDDDEILQSRNSWMECEITSLIQLRTSMEQRFHRIIECPEEEENVLWEEIATKMAYLGYYDRNGLMCKDKWESISKYFIKGSMNKKKDHDPRACLFIGNESINNEMGSSGFYSCSSNGHGINIGTGKEAQNDHHEHDGCYRYSYMLGGDESLWFQ